MNFDWTAEVVGRMHMAAITGKQLADEAGLTNSYLSAVLHNKKGNATTQQRIIDALERLEQRQASEPTVNQYSSQYSRHVLNVSESWQQIIDDLKNI